MATGFSGRLSGSMESQAEPDVDGDGFGTYYGRDRHAPLGSAAFDSVARRARYVSPALILLVGLYMGWSDLHAPASGSVWDAVRGPCPGNRQEPVRLRDGWQRST